MVHELLRGNLRCVNIMLWLFSFITTYEDVQVYCKHQILLLSAANEENFVPREATPGNVVSMQLSLRQLCNPVKSGEAGCLQETVWIKPRLLGTVAVQLAIIT